MLANSDGFYDGPAFATHVKTVPTVVNESLQYLVRWISFVIYPTISVLSHHITTAGS